MNRNPRSQTAAMLTKITVDISCFGLGQSGTRPYWVRTDALADPRGLLLQLYDHAGRAITRSIRRKDGKFDSENVMLHQSHIVHPPMPADNTELRQATEALFDDIAALPLFSGTAPRAADPGRFDPPAPPDEYQPSLF